jgi:hypothetical protein
VGTTEHAPAVRRPNDRGGRSFLSGLALAFLIWGTGHGLHSWSRAHLAAIVTDFQEEARVTESTPRVAMTIPFTELRKLERSAESALVFPTALPLKHRMVAAMKARIENDLDFMADRQTYSSADKSAEAWLALEAELGKRK